MFERCLYFNVNALSRTVNRIWTKAFKELGLSPSHAYLLRLVLEQPGLLQKDIAQQLKLEKSTVTRFLDVLQKKGYVRRQKLASGDRREQGILPTRKAEGIKDALNAKGDELYGRMLGTIGKDELTALIARLREVAQTIE